VDLVLLSGFGLIGSIVAAMAGLLHAELRDEQRAYRAPEGQTHGRRNAEHSYSYSYSGRSAHQGQEGDRGRSSYYGQTNDSAHAQGQQRGRAAVKVNPWTPFVVTSNTGRDEIRRQYRVLARTCHPDHGGDHNSMAYINKLYAELIAIHR